MKKVLLCERSFKGHRKTYATWLSRIDNVEIFLYTPENLGVPNSHYSQYICEDTKSFVNYKSWVSTIKQIVKVSKIDIVHILDGDSIMRFLGYGLHSLGCEKTIITYHHFFNRLSHRISYKLMCRGNACVVHTKTLEEKLKAYNLNVLQCDYPAFEFNVIAELDKNKCRERLDLSSDVPIIGIVGGICKYKHIVEFLYNLISCSNEFKVLIAGNPVDIMEYEIDSAIEPYRDRVYKQLHRLSDEEYREAIMASDIIYSLYGLDFDGASGPLTDAVCARKMVLASNHGSLGEIVSENMLGITADVTDDSDVIEKTDVALAYVREFKYGELAEKYRDKINPVYFQKRYEEIYLS